MDPGLGSRGRIVSTPLYQAKAEFFKALAHPARIRVLELLSERMKAHNRGTEQQVCALLAGDRG